MFITCFYYHEGQKQAPPGEMKMMKGREFSDLSNKAWFYESSQYDA